MSEWTFVWSTSRPSVPLGPSLRIGLSNTPCWMRSEAGGSCWPLEIAPSAHLNPVYWTPPVNRVNLQRRLSTIPLVVKVPTYILIAQLLNTPCQPLISLFLVHCPLQTPVEDVPLAIAPFQGRVLVGVGKLLRIYDMGKKKLLRKCENKVPPSLRTCSTSARVVSCAISYAAASAAFPSNPHIPFLWSQLALLALLFLEILSFTFCRTKTLCSLLVKNKVARRLPWLWLCCKQGWLSR